MVRVNVLGEDDELTRIVGPVPQRVKVDRAPERCGCRRRLDTRKCIAMAHTPPTFHIALHSSRHVHGDVTVHRNHTRHHAAHATLCPTCTPGPHQSQTDGPEKTGEGWKRPDGENASATSPDAFTGGSHSRRPPERAAPSPDRNSASER